MLGHPLCTNFAITKPFMDYVMHSSFAYRQFNSNFTCGDPTILTYRSVLRGEISSSVFVSATASTLQPRLSDFHLFGPLKQHLGGKQFADDDDVQHEVLLWMR
ncbi:hypothetical protein AVEN_185360-1 [Araneus ventricosus]|uniref:Uncharacterized protein n=1 Tax=Araneus ventricosus TaxID=182803 RepID=A0A4Y2HRC9_ARAVE|nr:hypothetical protein AVEN_185360-1 [Araneus ventricosus]